MKSCANCGLCYIDPNHDKYRCMRGVREPISDMFTLGRVSCDKHVEVCLVITGKEKK